MNESNLKKNNEKEQFPTIWNSTFFDEWLVEKILITFDYGGNFTNDYCFYNSSSVVDLSIIIGRMRDIIEEECQSEVASHAHKLPRGLYNVRDLDMSYDTVEVCFK